MLRMKSLFAVLLLAAMTLVIPAAAQNATPPAACVPGSGLYATLSASNVQMVIAGSSAMWQSLALGAYNNGNGVASVATQPTFHYVSTSNFSLVDERPTVIGGSATSDGGKVWIVWDSRVTSGKCNPRVWIYMNVDSVIGNRSFFGSIGVGGAGNGVYVQAPAAWPADDGGSQINSHLWVCTNTTSGCAAGGQYAPGVVPDAAIQTLFSNATTKSSQLVSVGATDIRPEDAYFAITRVNSALDPAYNSAASGPTGPGISGLGYNANNASGTSPGLSTHCSGTATAADLVGSGIHGNYPGDSVFNVVSFNIQGEDPFTCNPIGNVATIPVGALAIVVIHSSNGGQLGAAPVSTTTSAQVTAPTTSIPVTTATGMVVGETVTIAGAGAAGGTYTGQITAIAGCPGACTLTTATATSTTVDAGGTSPAAVNALGYNLLSDATTYELEQVFSAQRNGAGSFANCPTCTGAFGVVLREPLSGTYNTFEETTMRHPSAISSYRASQEYNVNGGTNNPLSGFDGIRWRAIGTGDMVKSVRDMAAGANTYTVNTGHDAIGYTFFSYGNVSTVADNSKYSYITLNGIDPIWHNYTNAPVYTGGSSDPGQTSVFSNPAAGAQLPGTLPGEGDLPLTCGIKGQFPCNESNLWVADNFSVVAGAVNPATGNPYPSYSFPNLRNGTYPAWSVVRLMTVAGGALQTALQNLVNTSNTFVVSTTPDYVPFDQVPAGMTGAAVIDPGMQFLRSHFGCTAATCGSNTFTGSPNVENNTPELGRDAGGAILDKSDQTIDLAQDGPEDTWVISFE